MQQILNLAELGYRVFPCAAGKKKPLTEHGFEDATDNAEQIQAWSEKWADCNWAIATKGLLVVDVDPVPSGDSHWLANDHAKAADLATAPMVVTPRGGHHYYFRCPAGMQLGNSVNRKTAAGQ